MLLGIYFKAVICPALFEFASLALQNGGSGEAFSVEPWRGLWRYNDKDWDNATSAITF